MHIHSLPEVKPGHPSMTRRALRIVGLTSLSILSCALRSPAQNAVEIDIGARAGIPANVALESRLSGLAGAFSNQDYQRSPYTIGPTVSVRFYDRLRVQFEALYTPFEFTGESFSPTNPSTSRTRGHSWDLPLIATYDFLTGPVRPFAGGGLILGSRRYGSSERTTTSEATGEVTSTVTEGFNSYSQLPAYVVDGGVELRHGRVILRPGVRYTRWSPVGTQGSAFRTENRFEFLFGVTFRAGGWSLR